MSAMGGNALLLVLAQEEVYTWVKIRCKYLLLVEQFWVQINSSWGNLVRHLLTNHPCFN